MSDCAEQYYGAWVAVFESTPKNCYVPGMLTKRGDESSMSVLLKRKTELLPYSGLFSRWKIFTNFADWPQFANIFSLKLYRCMVIY